MSTSFGARLPYWRLSVFYAVYFATVGAFLPYWGPYLKSLGFSAIDIGACSAMMMAAKTIAPYLWGHLADLYGRRMFIIRLASLASLLAFSGMLFAKSFMGMASVILIYTFFWNASLPQFEVVTLNYLAHAYHRYSRVRMWGSVGFIIAVVCMGQLLDKLGYRLFPALILVLFAAIWGASFVVPEYHDESPDKPVKGSILKILLQPTVLLLLLLFFLMQFGHAPYYTFFSIHLNDAGFSNASVGLLWTVGVIAEIIIFIMTPKFLPIFSARWLLGLCFGAAIVRWCLIGYFAEYVFLLVIAQIMHAFTFGVFHAVSINLIRLFFKGQYHGRGQALYSSISFGAGGAAGAYFSGYAWEHLGAMYSFTFAAVSALLGLLVVLFAVRSLEH